VLDIPAGAVIEAVDGQEVTPATDPARLLNRKAERSGGRLGYIHIPGMNDPFYRTTFEKVLGRHFFEHTTDDRSSGFEPSFRWTRPTVTLADENNYSDGHCFAWAYKEMRIGPLIGMPVPGTHTFGGGQRLLAGVSSDIPARGVEELLRIVGG